MLHLRFCKIEWTDYGARTVFPDGTETGTWPHPDDFDYRLISDRLGYGDDTLTFSRHHDLCHNLVEEWIHNRPSQVLTAVAMGKPLRWPEAAYEELAAQALQALIVMNVRPIIGGFDWQALRVKALECIARLDAGPKGRTS
jgi:hypothetical protein